MTKQTVTKPFLFGRQNGLGAFYAVFAPSLRAAQAHVKLCASSESSYRGLTYVGQDTNKPERYITVPRHLVRKRPR